MSAVMTSSSALVIQDDSTALQSIKEPSRPRYAKIWTQFKDFSGAGDELHRRVPSEDEVLAFIRHLRHDKGRISNLQISLF